MTPLYLFNPAHDLALANNSPYYTPPASACRLAEDLALLPIWYAAPAGRVLAPSTGNLPFLNTMQERLPQLPRLITEPELAATPNLTPAPWGWSPAVRQQLLTLGIPAQVLPSPERLAGIRQLSHRMLAVNLLPRLQLNEYFCGKSAFLTQISDIRQFVENQGPCILKAPLSGSGKGLHRCPDGTFPPAAERWCKNMITRQGGVAAEPLYEKVIDFAMLFRSDPAGVTFAGYSLFRTGASGAYEGNTLLSNSLIEEQLSAAIPPACLHQLRTKLETELFACINGQYLGYLGTDMMICRFKDAAPDYRIHPCVEVNMRMTMGVVARLLYDNYLAENACGTFQVEYYPDSGQLENKHRHLSATHPLQLSHSRITSGYLPLVPVTPQSHYAASAIISSQYTSQ